MDGRKDGKAGEREGSWGLCGKKEGGKYMDRKMDDCTVG